MKVYIASKYHEYETNRKVYEYLKKNCISAFLPETICKKETSLESARVIRDICVDEIKQSNILLAIDAREPFGSDVGWEIGYAYALKAELNYPIEIINLKLNLESQPIRAMNDPCFSHVFFSIDDTIEFLLQKQK